MKRKRNIKQIVKVAYHEAGHAVIQRYLRLSARFIKINTKRGLTRSMPLPTWFFEDISDKKTDLLMRKQMIVFYAGIVAQYVLTGAWDYVSIDHDWEQLMTLAWKYYGSVEAIQTGIKKLRSKTLALVKKPIIWRQIEAVASQLIKKRYLTSGKIKNIIRKIA